MTEEKTIEQKKAELEGIIQSSKKEMAVGVAKAAATVVLPLAAVGGVSIGVSMLFENRDLSRLICLARGIAAGYAFVSPVMEYFGEVLEDVKDAYQCLAYNRNELYALENSHTGEPQ